MNIIKADELYQWKEEGKDFQLIDVRESNEWDNGYIEGAIHIPMRSVAKNLSQLSTEKPVVLYCQGGIRSMQTIIYLQTFKKVKGLYNLQGGINAWTNLMRSKMSR
ncbi:MAG: rhodanese-like domain-containing protein [Hyphomicrobiales bacterium]